MSTGEAVGAVLGLAATACCCALLWRMRARRRAGLLPFSLAPGLDEEETRFQRRLEAATAGAFEAGEDEELELTAQEVAAIQSLERELREL